MYLARRMQPRPPAVCVPEGGWLLNQSDGTPSARLPPTGEAIVVDCDQRFAVDLVGYHQHRWTTEALTSPEAAVP